MLDFASIVSTRDAEEARKLGALERVLLFPEVLGGQAVPEDVVYLTPPAAETKDSANAELIEAIRAGMSDINIVPEYRGSSFVPTKIRITAYPGRLPAFERVIEIW